MSKTLVEIYNEGIGMYSSLCAVLEAIESRLSALESLKHDIARAIELQSDWNTAARVVSECHSHRISALEHPTPPDTQGEWTSWNRASLIWVLFEDGTMGVCHTSDLGGHDKTVTHIMPYHPGDSKPLPPKGDK